MRLNLGCGRTPLDGWTNVDLPTPGHTPDVALDLNAALLDEWLGAFGGPDAIEHAQLIHVLEHIPNHLQLLENLWHVLKPGGTVHIRCPHGASDDAWEDPTHVRPIFPGSFGYYSQPAYWRADYGYRADYRVTQCDLIVEDGADHQLATVARNVIHEMHVTLEAIKPARPPKRELQDRTPIRYVRART